MTLTGSDMAEFDTDLFVIGGGSGGVRAARIAAGHGARVMIAEEYRMGGTCVIRGCVPKKLLVYASHVHHEIEDAAGYRRGGPRESYSDRDRRRAEPRAGDPRHRTRDLLERGLPSGRTAEAHPDSGRRLHRAGIRLHLCRL